MGFIFGFIIAFAITFGWGYGDRKYKVTKLREAEAASGQKMRLARVHFLTTNWTAPPNNFLVAGIRWWAWLAAVVIILFAPVLIVLWLVYLGLTLGFQFGQLDYERVEQPSPQQPREPSRMYPPGNG